MPIWSSSVCAALAPNMGMHAWRSYSSSACIITSSGQLYSKCLHGGYGSFRQKGEVARPSDVSRYHTLKGVLQLSEVQACLRLTVPTAQHQLVSVYCQDNQESGCSVMINEHHGLFL